MHIDPALIALIGTLFGGVGIKVAESWLGRNKIKTDDATRIRDELRLEINAQKEEIKGLEAEVDRWRGDYYDLRDKYAQLQTELTIALQRIKDEAEEANRTAKELQQVPPPTPSTNNIVNNNP